MFLVSFVSPFGFGAPSGIPVFSVARDFWLLNATNLEAIFRWLSLRYYLLVPYFRAYCLSVQRLEKNI